MTTTVVKERQGSHVLILHSISLKSPPPSSGEIGCESSGEINMKPAPRANTLAGYLDQLADSEKHRARMREKALEGMVQELTRLLKRDEEFLDSNRMSLVDQCLRVIKKGRAAEELSMAARAIGLVAMILDDMENVHEIYRDAVPKLFEAVKSSSSKFKPPAPAQVLGCLAVLTFFGGYLSEHRLESMAMIWATFSNSRILLITKGRRRSIQQN